MLLGTHSREFYKLGNAKYRLAFYCIFNSSNNGKTFTTYSSGDRNIKNIYTKNSASEVIKVHSSTHYPDTCYHEEKSKRRYKNLKRFSSPCPKEKNIDTVRFVCISDTHTKTNDLHNELPDGEILIHAGDFTRASTKEDILSFNDFLGKIRHKFQHIVVIAGNHELSFDQKVYDRGLSNVRLFRLFAGNTPNSILNPTESKELLTNCTYIEDETIELFGIKIYGSPWQPDRFGLAFNKPRGEPILERWNNIPTDIDVLVTHGPPLGIGDQIVNGDHVGCAELISTVMDRVKPKYHIFGHIHEDYGIWSDNVTVFVNAAICNKMYQPVNKPIVFDYTVV